MRVARVGSVSGLMILVAGPYRSGTDGDPARIQANVDAMTRTALELWRRGHLPVMGEWFALPLIEAAVAAGKDDADADTEIFGPVTHVHPLLGMTAGDRLSRHGVQRLLGTSADGPIPGRNRAPERRNEHRVLTWRAAA